MNKEESKKITIEKLIVVGLPEREIIDNKVSYNLPVKLFKEDGSISEEITIMKISEENLMQMLDVARDILAKEEVDKAYV